MENTENEEIVEEQPPNYDYEIITTLATIGVIIMFFITKSVKTTTLTQILRMLFLMGFQLLAMGFLSIFTIVSWVTNSQDLKRTFMIISLIITGFLFLFLIGG